MQGEGLMTIEVKVPTLGESVTEATVGQWVKQVGDFAAQDEVICELETDKVALEVVATSPGVITEILAEEGAVVEPDGVLCKIDENAKGAENAASVAAPAKSSPTPAAKTASPAAPTGGVRASAAEAAKEHGVDLSKVIGTGEQGVITKSDVLTFALTGSNPTAAVAVSSGTESGASSLPREEIVPMTRLRKTIARRLKEAQNTAAMLTTYNEVDMTAIMALRKEYREVFEKKHGIRLGFMSFFIKACIGALKDVPEVNAEIKDDALIYKNYYDVGVAASTPGGLVVPVVRNCQDLSFSGIEKEIVRLGTRARDGKLSIDEMTGGTFTISNGGVFGSLLSSPILNAPQSGILGMHSIKERAMVVNGEIVIRPMMYLALSYDHRVVDGKGAVTFLVRVKEYLEDPQRLILDL